MTLSRLALDRIQERMEWHTIHAPGSGVAWGITVGAETSTGSAGSLRASSSTTPMVDDAIFRIASVTKPIVAFAAICAVQDRLIMLDHSVEELLPELANRRVLVDPDGPIVGPTVTAHRPITIRDLLTLRCGWGMDFDLSSIDPLLMHMWENGIGPGPTAPSGTPDEFLAALSALPLADQPGSRWRYHTGSDILGIFLERLYGTNLEAVLRRSVLDPLGMSDTRFSVPSEHLDRMTECRTRGEGSADGEPGEYEVWDEADGRWFGSPEFYSGATGLLSTTADSLMFGRMLLDRGDTNAGQLASPALIDEMLTDQLTSEQRRRAQIDGETTTCGWGFGIGIGNDGGMSSWSLPGRAGWDGGLGSSFLLDLDHDLCAVVLSTDGFDDAGVPEVLQDFAGLLGEIN